MATLTVQELTEKFIRMKSVSHMSNEPISDYTQQLLEEAGFEVERSTYVDPAGELKVNLVAKLGEGTGGLAFCSHNDTVPGQEVDWPAFEPEVKDGKLFGRGSCDMKGPLAATMVAAFSIDASNLKKPVYIIVTSDEETGLVGAKFLSETSPMLKESKPEHGVIAEPTCMIPVYSHKGGGMVSVTSNGRAAHSSTGLGESATLKIAPFLAEMAELDQELQQDASFMNDAFDPPHHTMNVTITDHGTALNVTAPRTTIRLMTRSMPDARSEEVVEIMANKAKAYGFDVESSYSEALYCPPSADIVKVSCELTGIAEAETVPYGTDGAYLKDSIEKLVVLGPGDIGVAHTVGEFVPLDELNQAVDVYTKMIERLCM